MSAGSVSAGIVVFHPDEAELARLVAAVAPGLREVVVYANSDLAADAESRLREAAAPTAFAVLRPGGNLGLGEAYDALLRRAGEHGCAFLFLLDQDSLPEAGTVPRLVEAHRALAVAGRRPAVVGPRPVGPDGRPMKITTLAPIGGREEAVEVAFVISSGSLIEVAAARAIGPFRADFFIDAIDLEWCFRARARGFSIWVAEGALMRHRLGRGVIRLPFGLLMADQPPRRLYTFVRNQLAMLRLPHVPRAHKAKTLLSLPLRLLVYLGRNGVSREVRAALRNGLVDGVRTRLGPPDRAFAPLLRRTPDGPDLRP